MRDLSQDEFLAKRSRDYDEWLEEGKIPYSSKVLPVNQSLSGDRWITLLDEPAVAPTIQSVIIFENRYRKRNRGREAAGFLTASIAHRHQRLNERPKPEMLAPPPPTLGAEG